MIKLVVQTLIPLCAECIQKADTHHTSRHESRLDFWGKIVCPHVYAHELGALQKLLCLSFSFTERLKHHGIFQRLTIVRQAALCSMYRERGLCYPSRKRERYILSCDREFFDQLCEKAAVQLSVANVRKCDYCNSKGSSWCCSELGTCRLRVVPLLK